MAAAAREDVIALKRLSIDPVCSFLCEFCERRSKLGFISFGRFFRDF